MPNTEIEHLSILGRRGGRRLGPDLSDDRLLAFHRAMLLCRRFDERLLNLQRQGRLGTFAPVKGPEASQVGSAATMGAGALTGHLLVSAAVSGGAHVVSESLGANVVADADRAAKGIAKQLAVLFAQEGWVSHPDPS